MLNEIQEKLKAAGLVDSTWAAAEIDRGRLVKLYRDYYDGDHNAKITADMKMMLRIDDPLLDQFNVNYCELIVTKLADRLMVESITGKDTTANKWATDLLDWNRFDGMQSDVHDASLRDGITYVMVAWDKPEKRPIFAHEEAYDGDVGMIGIYNRTQTALMAAVKIWYEGDENRKRINIYYPERVEKYESGAAGVGLAPITSEEPIQPYLKDGKSLGVPVIPFINKARRRYGSGISELKGAIPLQNALNRTFVSMIMTAELTGFPVRWAKGFNPSSALTPGAWVVMSGTPISKDEVVDVGTMDQGEIVPFIQQGDWIIDQMSEITSTPLARRMGGDSQSGEALKQRETGLLGKARRCQIKLGNAYEDMMSYAVVVQRSYGNDAPPDTRWQCNWNDAEIRNDVEFVKGVKEVADIMGEEQAIRELATVYKWDEAKIAKILQQKQDGAVNTLVGALNQQQQSFGAFGLN
jgi:hypothetical protein